MVKSSNSFSYVTAYFLFTLITAKDFFRNRLETFLNL